MNDPRHDPAALGAAWERRVYGPPSKRRMQVEAWMVLFTLAATGWCIVGGIWLGVKVFIGVIRSAW
jgi:hypothetical protein